MTEREIDNKMNKMIEVSSILCRGISMSSSSRLETFLSISWFIVTYIVFCFVPMIAGGVVYVIITKIKGDPNNERFLKWKANSVDKIENFMIRKFEKLEDILPSFERNMVEIKLGLYEF